MGYYRETHRTPTQTGAMVIGAVAVVVFLLLVILALIFVRRVDPGNVGVLVDYGAGTAADQPVIKPVQPGRFQIIWPLQRLAEYSVAQQTLTMVRNAEEGQVKGDDSVQCRDANGISINIDSSTLWRIDSASAGNLYLLRPEFPLTGETSIESDIVRRDVRSAIAEACSYFKYDEIYGSKRVEFGGKITEILGVKLPHSYLTLDSFILGEIHLPQEQQDAIDRKARAEQAAQEAAFLAEKAQNEAAAAIAKAEGDKQIAILAAQGQAESIRIINEQLSQSQYYIQYTYAQNWDGSLPTTLVLANGDSFPLMGNIPMVEPTATPEAVTP